MYVNVLSILHEYRCVFELILALQPLRDLAVTRGGSTCKGIKQVSGKLRGELLVC
jgi:hypothetical protein